MKEQKSMFLVTFSTRDGESEYIQNGVVFAPDEKQATAKAMEYLADFFCVGTVRDEEGETLFWSADGTRTIELKGVRKAMTGDLIRTLLIE